MIKKDYKYHLAIMVLLVGLIFATCEDSLASDENGEIFCLGRNIYFEAGNQPLAGRIAVGQVTINRRDHGLFPDNICDVVHQGGEKRHRCQFSWYCDGKPDTITDSETWLASLVLANKLLNYEGQLDITEGSLWYHANYIDMPYWSDELTPTVIINNHIFYK